MTPQLQQAIRLLQLSSIELQAEIQDALESNMMLEAEEGDSNERVNGESSNTVEQQANDEREDSSSDENTMERETIPDDLPVDSAWDDVYDGISSYRKSGAETSAYDGFENQDTSEKTLRDHLLWQLNLTPTSDTDKVIAMTIIDSLDDDGYLNDSLEDILASVKDAEDDPDDEIGLEEIEAVLHMIQTMDPPGIAARDIKECLGIQLKQCDPCIPMLSEAKQLVQNFLDLLASRDYNQLMRKMKLDRDALTEVVALIQSMNPRPGGQVTETRTEYVVPDVFVKKDKGVWRVELNTEVMPALRINSTYANLIKRADNSAENNSLKSHLQEARWFIKSLRSRSETLLRVTTCIVERQRAFLEYGEEAMKPLVLHDVAEALGMHESTISRVTTRKYMHTPRGIFELKYFFSSHVSTNYGGAASSTAIRALIKKLISAETPNKPLSDSKIAAILEDQGINVARRTVAKYREAMSIPPSNERKRLA
jgi:RNA polymerase sigma-54 factor